MCSYEECKLICLYFLAPGNSEIWIFCSLNPKSLFINHDEQEQAGQRICQELSAYECLQLTKKEISSTKDFSNILSGVQEICLQEYGQFPLWAQLRHVRNYTNGKSEARTFDPVFFERNVE